MSKFYVITFLSLALLLGCAKKNYMTKVEAGSFGRLWVDQPADKLIMAFPDAKIDELGKGRFRYTIERETEATFGEVFRYSGEENGRTFLPYAWFEIYFFVQDGVIKSYRIKRNVSRRESHFGSW